jgi:hypothetical protein
VSSTEPVPVCVLVRRHIDPGPSADAPQSIGFVAEHTAVPCTEVLTGGREHFVDGATNWVTMSGPSSFRRLSDPLPVRLITEEGTTVLLRNDNLPRRDVVREPRVRIDPLHSPLRPSLLQDPHVFEVVRGTGLLPEAVLHPDHDVGRHHSHGSVDLGSSRTVRATPLRYARGVAAADVRRTHPP